MRAVIEDLFEIVIYCIEEPGFPLFALGMMTIIAFLVGLNIR